MFYGLIELPWWGYVIVALVLTHITIASVTIFLHRCQAHRALTLHPIPSHFFRLWLWLTTGMQTKAWAAIHRKHHARCETEQDPHSPQILGLPKVLLEGAELYRREAKNEETLERFGQGTPDDWLERHIYTPFTAKGVLIMLAINLILLGVPGLTIWAIQMAWIPLFAAGVINGVGHYWGYRNFEVADASTNIVPWGILIGGEELHNNHHSYPTSAKLSIRWFEFDLGWVYIRLLSSLGLAQVKRIAPKATSIAGKTELDVEGLYALLANQVHVMTQYCQNVVLPLFKQEEKNSVGFERPCLDKIRLSLVRDQGVPVALSSDFEQFLEQSGALKVVCQFREQLKAIWNKTTATQKELLDALQEWCRAAEASGVQRLEAFSAYLKGYTISQETQ